MIKKTVMLLMICCFSIAALPSAAPAAQFLTRQGLVKKHIAGLEDKLLAAAPDDSTPLHALTIQFLDDLRQYGFRKNNASLQLAVTQYVADMKEQTVAAGLNMACVAPLLQNITANGAFMVQELVSGDTPVCEAISLSTSAASIISAQYNYDICVIDNTEPVDTTARDALVAKQTNLKYYFVAADVLNVVICMPTAGITDYVNLLISIIGLLA